jgi:hypothetical protein
MDNKLKFSKNYYFLGRNGVFKQSGIEIFDLGDVIEIAPITSKNETGRCWISIPANQIDEFIQLLKNRKL